MFADAKKTRQAELFRVSLDDYGIQRITDNGRIQSHPSLNETGLFYVDDRYSSTANGQDIIGAGLTRRQLKTTCDDTYNPCPVGFLCSTVLGIPTCSLESNGPCAGIAACPQGTECVEISSGAMRRLRRQLSGLSRLCECQSTVRPASLDSE